MLSRQRKQRSPIATEKYEQYEKYVRVEMESNLILVPRATRLQA